MALVLCCLWSHYIGTRTLSHRSVGHNSTTMSGLRCCALRTPQHTSQGRQQQSASTPTYATLPSAPQFRQYQHQQQQHRCSLRCAAASSSSAGNSLVPLAPQHTPPTLGCSLHRSAVFPTQSVLFANLFHNLLLQCVCVQELADRIRRCH